MAGLGTTCATRTTGNTVYSSSYDAWGNVTSRTTGGVSATLSYDALDHLVHWDGHAGTTEDYLYDASGERVMRRVVKTTGTQYFTYPFGLMDSTYNGSGVQQLENDYYTLAGRLIGERESGVTVFLLTDELGSVLTSVSAAAGSAAVINTQVYSPYGTPRYKQGTVITSRGFTGQYRDGSGLDYYNARYYDPVVGRFVSADTAQGNAQGMDPYSYVGNNPETRNDPTGQRACNPTATQCGDPCGGNCSPGDGGCSAHWHPPMAPCGGGGSGSGNGGCSANWHPPMAPCGGGGNDGGAPTQTPHKKQPAGCTQCEKVRQQRLAALHDQIGWERIAADVLVALGLLINWAAGTSITSTVSLVLGLLALFGNNLLPDVIAKLGNDSGLVEGLYRFASMLQQAAGWLEGAAAIYNGAAWWKKEVIDASVSAFKFGSLGPEQVMISALLLLAKPVVGVLLDSGAQFLYGKAYSDQADYEKQGSMPIQQWCAAYQAC